jgi:hypothetical protein
MVNAFFTTLARGLDDLSGGGGGLSSLPALLRAAALLRGLHSQLTMLVGQLHLPPGGRWLDEYMDETARLWDACLAVKLGLAAVERYCAAASCAVTALDDWLQDPSPLSTRQVGHSSRTLLEHHSSVSSPAVIMVFLSEKRAVIMNDHVAFLFFSSRSFLSVLCVM